MVLVVVLVEVLLVVDVVLVEVEVLVDVLVVEEVLVDVDVLVVDVLVDVEDVLLVVVVEAHSQNVVGPMSLTCNLGLFISKHTDSPKLSIPELYTPSQSK